MRATNTTITLGFLGVYLAACEPLILEPTDCLSHADCDACSSCQNGACAADPQKEATQACLAQRAGGRGGATTLPGGNDTTNPGSDAFRGIWEGTIEMLHDNWSGSGTSLDHMTVAFDDQGRMRFYRIADFYHEASFGMPPDEIPFEGTAIAHVLKADGFLLEFTIREATYTDTTFSVQWRAQSTAATPETPHTDYTVWVTGTLADCAINVAYEFTGIEYTARFHAEGLGVLRSADDCRPPPPAPEEGASTIWRGPIEIDHPGFAGPPIDYLTVRLDEQGRLRYFKFDEFMAQAAFGEPPGEFPLEGTAETSVVPGGGFRVRVTILETEHDANSFRIHYRFVDAEGTPPTNLTVLITGTRRNNQLDITYSSEGTLFTAPQPAQGQGTLSLQ